MDNNLLERLKKISLRFHIDPVNTVGHAAKVETIIKVLSDINKSYKNFLGVEFKKNPEFLKATSGNTSLMESFINELDLLAVDLDFGSFDIAVAPNIVEKQSPLFNDDVLNWKKSSFKDYKQLISGDFRNHQYMEKVSTRYSEKERKEIYKPLFNSIGSPSDYSINIKNNAGKVIRTLRRPTKERLQFYLPKPVKTTLPPSESTVLVYAKVKNKGEGFEFNKGNIKKVFHIEELEHDTYPFTPDYIQFQEASFILTKKLECNVEFNDDLYLIRNEELDLTAWGDSREEVEEAFSFSFYSLYVNFYKEKNSNLSKNAQTLKRKLKKIIKTVIDEA